MLVALTCILLVAGIIVLFVPMINELLEPRDARPLTIDEAFTREPSFFGTMLRNALAPSTAPSIEDSNSRLRSLPSINRVQVEGSVRASHGTQLADRLVSLGSVSVSRECTLPVAYVRGTVTTNASCTLTALVADASIMLGPNNQVELWLHAGTDITASHGCTLGRSATAGRSISLEARCTFRRLFGRPIKTFSRIAVKPASLRPFPVYGDIISPESIQIRSHSTIHGSLKSYGDVEIFFGATITGSVFARGSLVIHSSAQVLGNVQADGDIRLDDNVSVGTSNAFVTLYAGGAASLGSGVCIFGWIFAEQGGHVR